MGPPDGEEINDGSTCRAVIGQRPNRGSLLPAAALSVLSAIRAGY